MEFQVLGPVLFRPTGGRIESGGRLRQVLLGVLLARGNRPVSVDVLADALWGGVHDPRAPQKVQLHVHKLRRALDDPARLRYDTNGYRLLVHPGELDAERFESLVGEAADLADDPDRRAELVRKALDLWHGEPYDGLDVPLLAAESRRLVDRRLTAIEDLCRAELARDRPSAVVAELTGLVREHPLREGLHALLMSALHRSGRRADALAVYRDARAGVVAELGLEPGPELRTAEQEVLAEQPPAVPAQLPHRVRDFVGRTAELSELDGLSGTPLVVVVGTAGVGKTALAVCWAHRVRDRFPDGLLYVDLRGYGPEDPVSPDEALSGFLRELGVPAAGVPGESAARSARFRTLLTGRRMLVVLDNARTADQVRPLLPGTSSCLALVTSRDSLAGLVAREGAHRVDLGLLSLTEAVDLLRAVIGDRADGDPAGTAALADRCARLPLALRVAAESIRGRSPAALAAELAEEHRRLDLLDAGGDPWTAVRAVFSWSYHRLPTDAARLFRLCALCPGPDFEPGALAALTGSDARRALDVLVRAHLVEQLPTGRYRLHDLLRAYAAELAAATAESGNALAALLDWYLRTAEHAAEAFAGRPAPGFTGSREDALRLLDAERANLLAATVPGGPDYTVRLSSALWWYLDHSGFRDDALHLHTLAAGHRPNDPGVLARLGVAHYRLWQHEEAVEHLDRALQASTDDPSSLVTILNTLGLVHAATGRLRLAARYYEQALDVGGPPHEAPITSNLGDVHRRLGAHDRARRCLDDALRIAEQRDDRLTESFVWCHLGALRSQTGCHAEALDCLERALDIARTWDVRLVEGEARYHQGVASHRLGRPDDALRFFTEALARAESVDDRWLAAQVLTAMAETHEACGDAASAVGLRTRARAVDPTGDPVRRSLDG